MATASYFRYWGKADWEDPKEPKWHPLVYHSLDVAAVAEVLLAHHHGLRRQLKRLFMNNAEIVQKLLPLFIALHDLGKFSDAFQTFIRRRPNGRPYNVRHDSLGYWLWEDFLLDDMLGRLNLGDSDSEVWMNAWMRAVTGHHGEPPEVPGRLQDHYSQDDSQAALDFVLEVIDLISVEAELKGADHTALARQSARASWLLAGFAMLCDWIGSDTDWFRYRDSIGSANAQKLQEYWQVSLSNARRAMHESGVLPTPARPYEGLSALLPDIQQPSPLQRYAHEVILADGPQFFVLEDLTGSGKTEAALILAHRLMDAGLVEGLFIGLPTMATANQMYERLGKHYRRMFADNGNPSLMLAHSARHLHEGFRASILTHSVPRDREYAKDEDTASATCNAWLADHRKAALMADIGVGTIDQALLAVLHVRHQALRLLGLGRKVLIVDEVHACDSYMAEILAVLLRFQAALGGSAILLSATLPHAMRRKLTQAFASGLDSVAGELLDHSYPLATQWSSPTQVETPIATRSDVAKNVAVELFGVISEVERLLIEEAGKGKSVCWVRNSVADVLDSYAVLKPLLGDKLLLFHARYAMADRLEIEGAMGRHFDKASRADDRKGYVLIATQVVEQSLDWDFDVMVSDLAPIDLLVQRAGRVMRHKRDRYGNPLPYQTAKDERGQAKFYVLAPDPGDAPEASWLTHMLPRSAKVYPHHGELWLTARELKKLNKRGGWNMPADARPLIETVFGPEADYPAGLQRSALRAEGSDAASRALAASNVLHLDYGYEQDRSWFDDVVTPTRLGEATVTVRLARHMDDAILPWIPALEHAWDMSSLNVACRLIAGEIDPEGLAAQKERLPNKGRGSVLLVLDQSKDGSWQGEALDASKKRRRWRYDKQQGLTEITQKEQRA